MPKIRIKMKLEKILKLKDFWQSEADKLDTPAKIKKYIKEMTDLYAETKDIYTLIAVAEVLPKLKVEIKKYSDNALINRLRKKSCRA